MAVPDDKYADMKIICPSRTWNVHSNGVCPQSRPLDEQFDAGDLVSSALIPGAQQLTPAKILKMPDADELPVQALIDFLCNGDYTTISTAQEALLKTEIPGHAVWMGWRLFRKAGRDYVLDEGLMQWYEETQCPMTDSLVKVARAHARELLDKNSPHTAFSEVLKRSAPLCLDLAQHLLEYMSLADHPTDATDGAELAVQYTPTSESTTSSQS
ncbi:hypothetical protein Slin15195_G128290 [Septoria linicola]|uniref:Uncharacterized protein n=1 Tax=Septoria linicola TaxID=215465 RepID=A0A9Q9B2L8_9PEZI|nr:hypothetical protein Slin15195_G128290 [Septoria linicola]